MTGHPNDPGGSPVFCSLRFPLVYTDKIKYENQINREA